MIDRPGGAVTASAAIFLREVSRNARRWKTYGSRVAVTALMLLVVVFISIEVTSTAVYDPARLGKIGRTLFLAYVYTQIIVVCAMAPVFGALGLSEEREQDTLDLLRLTRLGPRQIVLGKVVSQLLMLAITIAAGAPVLSSVLGFGGVSPMQVVNALVSTLLLVLVLGLLGGVLGAFVRGAATPFVVGGAWSLFALIVVPSLYGTVLGRTSLAADLSPLFAPSTDHIGGLLPVVALLPTLALLVAWSGPLFTLSATWSTDEHATDAYDGDFWDFERRRWWAGLGGLVLMSCLPFGAFALWIDFATGQPLLGYTAGRVVLFAWCSLLIASATAMLLLAVLRGRELFAWAGRLQRVQREARASVERGRSRGRTVWSDPVLWREMATRAFGMPGAVARYSYPAWLVVLSLVVMWQGVNEVWLFGLTGFLIALSYGLTFGAETFATEHQHGTLELLVASTMRPWRIVLSKLVAVLSYGAPFLLQGWAVLAAAQVVRPVGAEALYCTYAPASPVWRVVLPFAWVIAVWVAITLWSMASTLLLQRVRLAWAANAALLAVWIALPLTVDQLLPGDPAATTFRLLLLPFARSDWLDTGCGVAPEEIGALVLLGVVSIGLYGGCVRYLRRWSV